MAFTRAFYLALLSGKTVRESFDIAREALKASPYVPDSVLEGEKFILLPDDSLCSPTDSDEAAVTCTSTSSSAVTIGTDEYAAVTLQSPASDDSLDSMGRVQTGAGRDGVMRSGIHNVPIFQSRAVAEWPMAGHILTGAKESNSSGRSDGGLLLPSISTGRFFDGTRGSSGSYFGSKDCSLPLPPPDFEGREVDMYRVITILLARRLVTLVGEAGVGKSSLVASVCTYVADRELFADGVFYLRAQGISTHQDFLIKLYDGLKIGPPRVAARLHSLAAEAEAAVATSLGSGGVASPSRLTIQTQLPSSAASAAGDWVLEMEEIIVNGLSPLRVLLVIDHIDELLLLPGSSEAATDLKVFLGRLFDRCKNVKVQF